MAGLPATSSPRTPALHGLGWAHSVEVFDREGELAGGLYGVRVDGLFAGESMFHHKRDASKVALMALVDLMRESGMTLLDVQWCTDHLASLGAVAIPRADYLARLETARDRYVARAFRPAYRPRSPYFVRAAASWARAPLNTFRIE